MAQNFGSFTVDCRERSFHLRDFDYALCLKFNTLNNELIWAREIAVAGRDVTEEFLAAIATLRGTASQVESY